MEVLTPISSIASFSRVTDVCSELGSERLPLYNYAMHLYTILILVLATALAPTLARADTLLAQYFRLLDAGVSRVEAKLKAMPNANLATLESQPGWRPFPHAVLPPAVLYTRQHPDNPRYHDPRMLQLALRIGDLLAGEGKSGGFTPRLDSHRDTYMWLEAYRLLEGELGPERKERWKRGIQANIAELVEGTRQRQDRAWYAAPFIGTSSNHYSLWASTLYLGGRVLGVKEWEEMGREILRRFVLEEQAPDGYWGEHSTAGPTIGYNYLTLSGIALYGEISKDPDVLAALRRATNFHKNSTFLDGTPIDVFNDRNRYWSVSPWGHFAFSHFPDGRGYAAFLTSFFDPQSISMEALGRIAQNAIYYHEGPSEAPPQQQASYAYRMSVPAGVRKTGPWQVALSGMIDTQARTNQFFLDRQGHVSIFHQKAGLIISGANSKRQPELATFTEGVGGETVHMPMSSRLQMSEKRDRLSLAYNTFFADLYVDPPSANELDFRFNVYSRGTPAPDSKLTLQLVLTPGETLVTGTGRSFTVGAEPINLSGSEIGGVLKHHGWTLALDPSVRLQWPVYPHNPYANKPETNPRRAVAILVAPLNLKPKGRVREQEIGFKLTAH